MNNSPRKWWTSQPLRLVATITLSAFVGALFGYWFATYQHSQEIKAKRDTLITVLRQELARIPSTIQSYDKDKAFYRDPIRLVALTRLIDGETLEYRKDARLIEDLLNLNVVISRHNDFVQMTNLAQATTKDIPDAVLSQWYQDVKQRLADILFIRKQILEKLP